MLILLSEKTLKIPINDSDHVRTGWWIEFRNASLLSELNDSSEFSDSSELSDFSDFCDSSDSFETSEENDDY